MGGAVGAGVRGGGFSFEGGLGAVIYYPAPAGETAIAGHVTLGHEGALEFRTRGVFGISPGAPLPNFGLTTTVGYRTPTAGAKRVGFNFGFGVGGALSLGCGGGDYCGGLGGVVDLSPRLVFRPKALVQLYLGLNTSAAILTSGNVPWWLTAGIVFGCTLELGPQTLRAARVIGEPT